jgi:glycosyltransferase involved in cell wall biosynthesis
MGIDAARGTYLAFLDDDDEYLSSFLSRTYATLKNTPEQIGISWCGAKYIHYPNEVGRTPIVRVRKFGPHSNRQALLADFLSIGTGQGVTIKATCLEKVGPFNGALKVASDSDMFFRILEQGFLPLAVRGVHIVRHDHCGTRLTGAALYPERIRAWEELLLRRHSEFLDEYPTIRNNLLGYVESLKQNLGNGGSHRHACYTSGTRDNWLLSLFTKFRDRLKRIERPGRIRKLTETN